jgi:DNA-binding beta-propeller fold protein YncE
MPLFFRPFLGPIALLGILLLGGCRSGDDPPAAPLSLQTVQDVSLPGGAGRFGGQEIDQVGRRLYVTNPGRNRIDVVDLDRLTTIGSIEGLPEVRAVRLAPDIGKLFATVTGADELVTVDVATLQVVARTPTGRFPDGLAYDPDRHLVAVSNRKDGTETIVEARSGAVLRTVSIDRLVGDVVYEPISKLMVVTARPPNRLVTFDPATGSITHRIKLPGCHNAGPVMVEPSGRWAFVSCQGNGTLSVVDVAKHRQRGLRKVGEAPDVITFDAASRALYVATESGVLSVFELGMDGGLRRTGQGMVAPSAHSVAVDPADHRLFFPLTAVGGHPVVRVMRP